jgi:hypothetical protein
MKDFSDPPTSPGIASPRFRLSRALGERKAREGSYAALARAIEKSNAIGGRADQGRALDRRKLKAIVDGAPNLVLSLQELRALDCYLERYGEGLAYVPLFEKPDLMQTLADSGRVTFLLGSKPEPEHRYFSHWDVLAMAEIQRGISSSEMSVRFDIQDVLLHETLEAAAASTKIGGWSELLADQGPSLVCLGSSRTSPAAEVMLCRMFQCSEFENPSRLEKQRLPFHFVWKPMLDYVFPSCFHLDSADISSRDPAAATAVRDNSASAVVTAKDVFVDPVHPDHSGDTYGICIAQRRKRGQVWLVLAGVTGVATFVAAKLAKSLATRLHEQKPGQDSDVYWAVIRAGVDEDSNRPLANVRTFAKEAIVSGPHVWRGEPGAGSLAP